MPLVAGVDSSTQSCKVVIRDAETGALVRQGRAPHPDGTEVAPATPGGPRCGRPIDEAGGLDDVAAVSVAGQQHGMVCLDEAGEVVRPALLWNDTRSAGAAADLIDELGGGGPGAGSGPTRSAACRWPASPSPSCAGWPGTSRRTRPGSAAVCLPHDWLTWRLAGAPGLDALRTDRSDASGTGYWSPATGEYRPDLLELGLRPAAACCPRCSVRPSRPAPDPRCSAAGRRAARPGRRGQRRRRARRRRRPGRRGRLDRHLRHRVRVADVAAADDQRRGRRLRRRHRPLPAAGLHAQRRPGAGRRRAAARRRPRRAVPSWRWPRRPAPTGWCWCRTWRASGPRTGRCATGAVHGLTLATSDPGAPGPGRRRGHALRARRRPGRADRAGRHRPTGSSWSAAAPASAAVRRIAPQVFGLPGGGAAARGVRRRRRRPPGRLGRPGRRDAAAVDAGDPEEYDGDQPSRRSGSGTRPARDADRRSTGSRHRAVTSSWFAAGHDRHQDRPARDRGAPRSTASWCSWCSPRWTTWRSASSRRCTGRSPTRSACRERLLGLVTAVSFLVSAVAAVGWAYVGDRTNRKPLLMVGTADLGGRHRRQRARRRATRRSWPRSWSRRSAWARSARSASRWSPT